MSGQVKDTGTLQRGTMTQERVSVEYRYVFHLPLQGPLRHKVPGAYATMHLQQSITLDFHIWILNA